MPKSERKKKMKQWLSGKRAVADNWSGVLGRQTKQSLMENQSGKYYQAIDQLPLYRFIECMVDENLQALVISGNPPLEQLQYGWSDINSQYAEAVGDAEYKHYIHTVKQLTKLKLTIVTIEKAIECLRCFPYVQLFDFLNESLKTDFKFDFAKPDEYNKLLDRCFRRSRGIVMEKNLLEMQVEDLKTKYSDGKKVTREYFIRWMITLSDHAQTTLSEQMTVFEFCERIRRLKRENDILEAKNAKKK